MKKIAILIPCYNEEQTIYDVIIDYKQTFPDAEIFVCNNKSTDCTAEQAKKAGAVVFDEQKQGKGYAVRTLFEKVDADCYLMVDGDSTYPAKSAQAIIDDVLNNDVDMAVGDRLSKSYYSNDERLFHKSGNALVSTLLKILYHSNIKDPLSGMRAFSKAFVDKFDIPCKGFELETEFCIFATKNNFKTSSIIIDYFERPEGSVSKLSTVRDGIKILFVILKRLFK